MANAEGDLALDLVPDSKIESILLQELEKHGFTEDKLDTLRGRQSKAMLADMQKLVEKKGDVNALGPNGTL